MGKVFLVQGELNHTPVKWGDPHSYGVFAQVTEVEE